VQGQTCIEDATVGLSNRVLGIAGQASSGIQLVSSRLTIALGSPGVRVEDELRRGQPKHVAQLMRCAWIVGENAGEMVDGGAQRLDGVWPTRVARVGGRRRQREIEIALGC